MTTDKTPQPHRLQQDPAEGDRQTIERQLADQDNDKKEEDEPSEALPSTQSGGSIEGALR